MPTEKRYEINELTDTESTADAGNMLNGKAVVDEPTVTEFTEIESMDEIIKLFGVFDENLKIIEAETGTNIAADSEKINISGKQSAVDIARNVVEKLLSLIKRGESIDRGRIRYAIDLAREGNSELILELADDVIAFTSKGKQIKPLSMPKNCANCIRTWNPNAANMPFARNTVQCSSSVSDAS